MVGDKNMSAETKKSVVMGIDGPKKKFEFVNVKIGDKDGKIKENYNIADTFTFEVRMMFHEPVENDLQFEVVYIGDARTETEDQSLGKFNVGSSETGEVSFMLETGKIDLSKVPIKGLFGVTSIMIVGKYKNEIFVKVGYLVNVTYPGVPYKNLMDEDDTVEMEEEDNEEEEDAAESDEDDDEDDEELVENDEEDEEEEGDDEDDEEDDENNDEEDDEEEEEDDEYYVIDEEENKEIIKEEENEEIIKEEENKEIIKEEENASGEEEDSNDYSTLAVKSTDSNKSKTPIVSGVDEFEFKGIAMKQSLINFEVNTKQPIIQVFDIDFISEEEEEEETFVESSDSDDYENTKKSKLS